MSRKQHKQEFVEHEELDVLEEAREYSPYLSYDELKEYENQIAHAINRQGVFNFPEHKKEKDKEYGWFATEVGGKSNTALFQDAREKGWLPVPVEKYPEYALDDDNKEVNARRIRKKGHELWYIPKKLLKHIEWLKDKANMDREYQLKEYGNTKGVLTDKKIYEFTKTKSYFNQPSE